MYEQLDGISMGRSLGSVLANIIVTEWEKVIVGKFIDDGTIKFFVIYVDDTLFVIKRADISFLNKFNSFDDNLKYSNDTTERIVKNCIKRLLKKKLP